MRATNPMILASDPTGTSQLTSPAGVSTFSRRPPRATPEELSGPIDVQEVNRIADLDRFRGLWDALLRQTERATFFQSLDWLEAYWRHYGAGQKLRVLIVSSAGRPIGIVPLVVKRQRTKVGTVRVLTYPLHDWGSFYGPVGPEPGVALEAALVHLGRTRRDWDTVDLRWVGATEQDAEQTERAMRGAGFQAYKTVWNRTALVELAGTWDAYFAARSGKWRSDFRRRERKLAARARITHVRYRPGGASHQDDDPRWDLYDACEAIARRSWQAAADGSTLSDPSIRPFLRDVHAAAARTGGLDLNLLLVDGRPVAFAYNYHYAGSVFGLRAGYDPQFGRDGVGGLLAGYAIEDSFRRGDHTYDLGVGSLEAKRHLLTRVAPLFRYSHFHPTAPKAQLLHLKRWAEERFCRA